MALLRRIVSLGKRARLSRDIEAELREHIAMCIDDNMAQGMSREEAERDARRRFGNPSIMGERVSAEDAALSIESLWNDLRSALRVFTKSPGFSFVVVATLALGIGANTAIFELLDAVLLQSLPVKNPQELAQVRVVDMSKARGGLCQRLSGGNQSYLGEVARQSSGFLRNRCMARRSILPRFGRRCQFCEWPVCKR